LSSAEVDSERKLQLISCAVVYQQFLKHGNWKSIRERWNKITLTSGKVEPILDSDSKDLPMKSK
jgi:hypothetical protein